MLTKEEMPACPVATTVSLIGSKWKHGAVGTCVSGAGAAQHLSLLCASLQPVRPLSKRFHFNPSVCL